MSHARLAMAALMGAVLVAAVAGPLALAQTGSTKPTATTDKIGSLELAALIDRRLEEQWAKLGVQPVAPADDATFYRRVHLDLAGKIPTVTDIQDFLDDDRPDKKTIWIDKILETLSLADHLTDIYRAIILPHTDDQQTAFVMGGFDAWLRKRFKEGAGYDKMVREMLTTPGGQNMGFNPNAMNDPTPVAFYVANENKPENLAGATARVFLGVKIECAQCHKHPFAAWTQEQFWQFAAFFSRLSNNNAAILQNPPTPKETTKAPPLEPDIEIPKTTTRVKAQFIDGTKPASWNAGDDPVKVLADWVTSPKNPYFSRVAVNSVWQYFFGYGLVDPVDDFGPHNLPSHPELLDEMAEQFVQNGYDVKYLVRAIVNSKAYQLASSPIGKKQEEDGEQQRLFNRMPLRALSGEQLFDSLAEVMEYKVDRSRQPIPGLSLTMRDEFLSKFGNPENKRVDTHASILQALHLMNGRFMSQVTSLTKNKTLESMAASKVPASNRVVTLFRVALSRMPTQSELERFTRYIETGGPSGNRDEAMADVLWVLLNSVEFSINR
jgi:hypothetical protein